MKHPELVRMASVRCRISVERLIYDAMGTRRWNTKSLSHILDQFMLLNEVPPFVEDYALKLLAENEKRQKELLLC